MGLIEEITAQSQQNQENALKEIFKDSGVTEKELQDENFRAIFQQLAQNPDLALSILQASEGGADTAGADPALLKQKITREDTDVSEITPAAGFVVKTRLAEKSLEWEAGTKVFVNMTHSANIPQPPPATDDQVRAAVMSGDPSKYKVPLSLSSLRTDVDKSGAACLVIDACVHTTVLDHAKRDADFREFVVSLALQWATEREKLQLDLENYTFPKMPCKGEPAVHIIKRRKRPAIVEVEKTSRPVPAPEDNKSLKQLYGQLPTPKHEIVLEPTAGKPEYVIITAELPALVGLCPIETAADCFAPTKSRTKGAKTALKQSVVQVTRDALIVAIPNHYFLQIKSPFPFQKIDSGLAEFDKSKRKLTITLKTDV